MIRSISITVLLIVLAFTESIASDLADKVPSRRNFDDIRRQVETLRGKKFLNSVPVYKVSERELRAIADRELERQFPGSKLRSYEELLAWLDIVPRQADLKSIYGDYLVDQVAGLYDSQAKEMCIPSFQNGLTNAGRKAAEKKLEALAVQMDDLVLAHEFTHALEDQYWPLDDPKDYDYKISTDRGTAHEFVNEGSATRQMIEAVPAQWGRGLPDRYFLLWNFIHSGLVETLLKHELSGAWKSSDALAAGVPEPLARTEAMPYSFGYTFCTEVMHQWGLDGLDYMYNHPPVSSAQVMHPKKAWEWRDLPAQIDLPETLPGNWKQISLDCLGEAGMAALFGCQFKNLNYGLEVARGWHGDHVGLFENPDGHRLLLWASSWGSTNAAGRFARAWMRERQVAHQALLKKTQGSYFEWESPDGRVGFIQRDGRQVILLETDNREGLQSSEALCRNLVFTEPVEEAMRTEANSALRRFNPVWSWQKDGDYVVTRSFGGLLSRHDRNAVGRADRFVLGALGESRRTTSFQKWELGAGLIAWHESEACRATSKTTWLPWGVLASHSTARLPQSPDKNITSASILWGLGASTTADGEGARSVHVLPFGLLFRRTKSPERSSTYIMGTGISREVATDESGPTERFRLLGIPLWSTHPAAREVRATKQ